MCGLFFNDTATTEIYTLSLHDALPIFHFVFSPIEKVLWQDGESTGSFFAGIFNAKELKVSNQNLADENFILKNKLKTLENLKSENQSLRSALDAGFNKKFNLELANVISKTIEADIILIDKGKGSGLEKGMAVISESKILIGTVKEVFSGFSNVALISHPETSFGINIESFFASSSSPNIVMGLSVGSGNFGVDYQMVPEESILEARDIVFTSNVDAVFPADLLVGEIKTVQPSDTSGFKQGEIRPYFIGNIPNYVFIVKNFKK